MTPWDWLLGASIALFIVAGWLGWRDARADRARAPIVPFDRDRSRKDGRA